MSTRVCASSKSGEYEAIILALSGLRRLGKTELVRQVMPIEIMCPAAGQGALAIEIRAGDDDVRSALAFLDDKAARSETECERALLKKLGGGCQVPIGASAKFSGGTLHLEAVVASPDGKTILRESGDGKDAVSLGERVGGRSAAAGRRRRFSSRFMLMPRHYLNSRRFAN